MSARADIVPTRAMSAYDAVDGAHSAASKCYRLVASKPKRFKEVRPGDDDVLTVWKNWRGHDDVMQTRSIRGSGEPAWVIASLNACLRLGPDPRRALWPAATSAAQTGRTHDRTRPMLQMRQKVLAKAAPSTHDPKRTSAPFQNACACRYDASSEPWGEHEAAGIHRRSWWRCGDTACGARSTARTSSTNWLVASSASRRSGISGVCRRIPARLTAGGLGDRP